MCVFCDVINLARACHNYYKSEFNLFSWRMFISQHSRITHPWNAINTADPALYIELNLTYPNGYDVWRIARNLSCYSRWSRERRGSKIFSVQFVDRIIRVLEVCHVSTHFVKIALFQHGQNLTRKRIYVGQQNVQFVTMTYWRQIQTSHWKTGCDPFLATIYWKRF